MYNSTSPNRLLRLVACLVFTLPGTALAEDEADLGPGVSLTVYNQNFAIVKERRTMRLDEGAGTVKFPEVAATIVPESVQFSSLRPGGAKVLHVGFDDPPALARDAEGEHPRHDAEPESIQ